MAEGGDFDVDEWDGTGSFAQVRHHSPSSIDPASPRQKLPLTSVRLVFFFGSMRFRARSLALRSTR